MSRPLHPDVMLETTLSAICSRNRYARDPGPVIAELIATAGERTDILARTAGGWVGYYGDEYTTALVAAIIANIPGAEAWAPEGRARRSAPAHRTTGPGPVYVSSGGYQLDPVDTRSLRSGQESRP